MSWHKLSGQLLLVALVATSLANERVKRQTSTPPEQPRIVTNDGHLLFQTGANHNISFQSSSGGSVMIDGQDVKQMATTVQDHTSRLNNLQSLPDQVRNNAASITSHSAFANSSISQLNTNYATLNRKVAEIEGPANETRYQLDSLTRSLNNLTQILLRDECATGPCQHAGTCIDMFDTYRCLCPTTWQGPRCEVDVNECSVYQGTQHGCASGSTCHNTNGGFSCLCPTGRTGVLCNIQTGGCDRGSDSELCGHGTCLSAANGQHTCLCDEGWGKDNANPAACTVDIDECADVRTPRCHAGVQCLNIPGGYLCGPCPLGYTGNGHVCNDIDECASVNGGCSLDPIVECTNTLGSYRCGSCPAGYSGNGQFCIWFGECRINNGGCSPQADCTDAPGITRTCRCQAGWTGSGEGANGCRLTSGTQPPAAQNPCANNPCQHGTCFSPPNSSAYTCTCESGWTGHHCDVDINECTQGVCQNGGTCNNIPGSYNCSCDQFHTGQNCETRLWQCGGVLSGNTGSFSFPASLDNYPHNASCAWRINVPLNKIISVVFDRFNLESSTTCAFDYLQLHDGPTASSQMIGKYCGTQLQGQTINTTHNQLYFWFKSDASLHDNGFNLTWQALDPECGGDLRDATHGVIQSPGYPGNYPINRTCVWTIRVVAGFNIHISFSAFDLENHSTCNFDSLEFRDGLLPTDPLVTDGGPFCSDVLPAPFTNEGNELYIKFHSDFSATGQGFQFNWNALESDVTTCGGALNTSDGTFTTPNYPSHYDHNGFCVWTITLPPGERIALTFTVMDLEAQDSCIFDWVKVHDGIDETFPQYGPFCGNQAPAPIISAGNELYIRFHSDSSVSGAGFIATWTTSCGGTYTAPTGVLTSPNFPGFYPISKNCFYTITAPEDRVVKITFDAFSVESGSGEAEANCEFDSLTVYDGATENAPVLRSLCGTVIPQPITSSSSSMLLKFVTDGSINDLGFRANYEFVNSVESGCGGVLTGPSGQIDSPGHPNEYPHGADCVWEIRIDPGSQIRLTFNFFSIESSESCLYDYVMVAYNRSELETSSRYCGPVAPPVFTSPDNVMFVRFKADTSIAHEGFTASYVSYNHSWCGDQRRTLPGLITSPEWPAQYPHNRQCIWTIIAPDNHQVALNFTDFRLEAHFNCQYDYVELRNGGFSTSPLIGKFCGSEFTTPIVTQSNRVWIKFASDASNTAPGFRIWYDDAGEGCGADLTATSGRFTSPNFPSPYGRNAECIWTVTVSQGSTISLSFIDIDMESSAGCQYDYVEAIDGLRIGDSQRYCVTDGTLPPPFETTSNVLTVKLRSDGSISGRGFHAAYYADCSGVRLTAHSGVIESPNFPNEYPHNRECTWIIAAPEGNNINVAFSHFYVEDHEDCHYDYLELRDGTTETSPLLGQYCGSTLPPRINSTTNNLFIKFVSDSSLAENGFRLEYATVGCGRDLTDASGEFTTPNWPNEYPHNRECIWRITVEEGMRINLTITDVNIEFHRDCNYDYLQIRAGDHVDSPELVKMCRDHDSNHTITSISNVLYIKFKADASSAGTGFRAVYSTIPGGCGGRFTALEGSIYSPNFPDNYPHNLDCSWDISVGVTSTVSLTFSEFILENHVNCVFDYVQIIDGFEDNSRLLHTLCGNMTGTSYMSTGRDMRVRLRTDSSAAAKGFQGTYTSGCGGDILVTEDGIITSPHYPNNYDGNTNCTWVLRGAQAVDRITIQFTNMDVELHENCSSDYISIFQGDSTSAPQQGIPLCGDTLPRAITSSGNALTIFFSSDATVSKPGFSLQYSKSASFCGGTFTAPAGAFSTPNYPSAYPLNAECIWYLNTPPGNRIQLVFRAFNLESDSGCDRDYVEIRDGVTQAQLGRYCGASIPTNVTTGNSIIVKFRSNEAVTRSGFLAEYSTANGGDLIGNTGRLSNPTYPRPYPSSQDYIWHIIADQGMNVRINITDMDIEYSSTCIFDYVAFYAGRIEEGSPDPPTTRKLCGSTPPPVFVVTNNVVAIKFHTDISASGRGFALNWIAVPNIITTPDPTLTTPSATCNSELVATETIKNFTSPNFPSNYDNSLNCQWSIQAPSGVVSLTFTSMSLEENTLCLYDRVIILDGLTREIGRICPVNLAQPLNYTSTGSLMTVKFLSDSSVTRPGFVALYSTACGGTLTADSGTIQSPNFPAAYPANQECVWVIQVTIGRQVEYTMNNFNLPQTTNCSGDRLILLNGGNENSPLLLNGSWAYCGGSNSAPPTNFISASRYLYVKFISDGTNSGNTGFSLSYTEKSLECGGHLTLDDDESRSRGNLLSPNYGPSGTIPHNADCEWVIMAPANERIQLDFDDFDLEYHAGCEYDHLRVHDGGTENSAQLASLCGKDQQSSIVSTSNVMYLRLISDNSAFSRGFNITYKIATCGGTITANSGFFMSPNYPLSYPNSIQCDWYINGPTGHYIKFDFQAFELAGAAGDGSCRSADTLTFYDRNIHGNATSVIDQSYCGTTAPTDVRTSDSRAYVKFVSNANAVGTGFKVTFNSSVEECGGRLTAPFGRFTSPNYPGYYAHSRQCYWYITAPEGKKVTLTFDDFQLENNVVCAFDFVDVYNGHFESSPLVGRFCGNLTNHTVSSSGSTMMVQFKTDASVSGFGFAISYNTFEDANCGGLITGQPGQVGHITSPGYSESLDAGRLNMTGVYPARTQCNWRLQAPSTVNSSIVLAFKDDRFDLEYDGDCRHDSLELREGSTVQGRFIGKFCGNGTENLPFAIEGNGRVAIPGTELWVNFVSDATIQRPGFNFTYQFAACGGMLSAPNGIITSPNYPGNYDHNMGCAWEISVAEGMLIQLEIVDFELENHDKCNFDVVNVHNGESVDSPIMAKWCGLKTVGTNVTTQSNKMRIEFLSDFSLSARGFKLRWSTRQSGCGGMLHAQAGTITSPSYPANYPHNVECIWDIVVQEGYQVIFDTSQPFDIESSDGHCYFDYVEFFNVDSDGAVVSLGKHCGRAPPPVIRSETNKLRLKFRSDPWTNAAGFSGDWTVGCGGTYSDEAGEIYSPGYPQNYANNLTCDYTITANPNQFVVLQFDEDNFSLEPNINCLYDFVAVYPVHSNNSAIGKFCGRTAPEPVATEGQMAIRFQTDATNTDRGFKATFSKQECGGNITNQTSGEIKSPTHPVQYIHNMNCTWTITVSANMSVQLKFAEFHLESHSTCNFDWLALYDGPDINSRRIGKYCGDSIPENVQTTGNVLTANFRTDGSVSKDGFRAIFSERHGVLQGCGGVINDTQGVITPVLNANGNYHDNLDCVWNVIVPSDKVIQLNVTGVNIEEQNNCPWDGLELIDGLFAHDNPLTSTICGRNLSVTYSYTTTTNVLRVRFFSDSSINWPNGFMLQFTAVDPLCGGIIYATSAVQTISSPNYPNSPSRPNLNCRWIISSNDTVMGIRITVTDINLLDSSDCKRDYLQLKDDPFILPSGPGQEVLACGTHQPHVFESAGRNAQVNYKYSGLSSLGYKGFSLSYQISTCNRTYDTPSGRVITPGWPNVYHHNLNCIYHINVEIGMRVAMYFKEFELEAQSVCSFDHLEVFDGPSTSSPSLGKFCGNIDLAPIVSSSNQITLHIKTDSSVSKKGFDMSYTSTQTGCGGRLSSAIGNFESHPDLFEAGPVSCEWVVEVTTRLRPNITFSWLDLLTGPSCANGSLEIRDGSSASSPLVGTYCDRIPPAFVGSSNSLYVKLVTNTTLPRQAKFRASYVTLDQHLLTDDYDFYNYIYSA